MSLPIIIAAAAAVYLFAGKQGSSKKGSSKGASKPKPLAACSGVDSSPVDYPTVAISHASGSSVSHPRASIIAFDAGERDPIELAKIVLDPFIQRHCMEDLSVKRQWTAGSGFLVEMPVPTMVYHTAQEISDDLRWVGKLTDEQGDRNTAAINAWWSGLFPGVPLP